MTKFTDNKTSIAAVKFLPWVAAIAMFMQSLDSTILNTALPSIAKDLHHSPLSMESIIISYVLVLALLIPLSGWMADRFGSRRVFIWAVGFFTLGSLCSALSGTLGLLVVSRIIQASGASMMVPIARLDILYTYPKNKLLNVMNFITIPGLVGPIIGPTLGGWLVDISSWHWIFLINIPIGIAGMLFAYKIMPNYVLPGKRFDFIGMLYFDGSIVALTLAIELGADNVIGIPLIIVLLILGVILMELYYKHFQRIDYPLIDLHLIGIRTLRVGVLGNLLTRLGVGGLPLLMPLLFQVGFGHPAIVSGMMLIPSAVTSVLVKSWVVPIVRTLGYKKTLIINTVLIAIVTALFAIPNIGTPLPLLIPLLVMYGAVNSIQMSSMNTLALSDLDNKNASMGNSLLMVMQQLSMSLGVSVSSFLLAKYGEASWIDKTNPVATFRYTFLTLGIITLFSAFVFFRLKNTDGNNLAGIHTQEEK